MAIKSAEYAHQFLDDNDVDYVESFDYFESDWIKTGMKEERLIYRHFFNERTQKRRFAKMSCGFSAPLGFPMRRFSKLLCATLCQETRSKRAR